MLEYGKKFTFLGEENVSRHGDGRTFLAAYHRIASAGIRIEVKKDKLIGKVESSLRHWL